MTTFEDISPSLYLPEAHEEDSTPIIPKFWTGTNSLNESKFVIDVKTTFPHLDSLSDIIIPSVSGQPGELMIDLETEEGAKLKSMMRELYDGVGAVNLRNTGMTNPEHMKAAVQCLTQKSELYEGGANPRDKIADSNVYETGAPLSAHLHYHHEMAYVQDTAMNLGFVCIENTNIDKGHTYISDNIKATRLLSSTPLGKKLRSKGLCYIRKLPDRKYFNENPDKADPSLVYNFWQRSFLTEDATEAEQIAKTKKQLEVEWEDSPRFGRYMVTKHYTQAYEYCPYTDKNVLYSSIADDYMWFDSWDGVMALPHHERPLKLNFGDGEVMTREEKQLFVDVYDQAGIRIPWSRGDVCIIDNTRFAHGRPPIHLEEGEKRHLGVVIGPLKKKVGVLDGKWD